jgi:hypothetical protein
VRAGFAGLLWGSQNFLDFSPRPAGLHFPSKSPASRGCLHEVAASLPLSMKPPPILIVLDVGLCPFSVTVQ